MQCIIASLRDYDVTEKCTDLVVRHEDMNERLLSLWKMADFITMRKWNCKEFPNNEEAVLIIVETRYPREAKPHRRVLRAFHEDGTVKEWNSDYGWELIEPEIDDAGDTLVPRGWYELTDYGEENSEITDPVIAWQPLPDPWEGMEESIDADKANAGKKE